MMVLAASSPSTATVCLVLTETRRARLVAALLPAGAAFGRVEALRGMAHRTPLEPDMVTLSQAGLSRAELNRLEVGMA